MTIAGVGLLPRRRFGPVPGDTLSTECSLAVGCHGTRAGQGASATWEHSPRLLTASPKIKIIQLSAYVYQAKEFTMFK